MIYDNFDFTCQTGPQHKVPKNHIQKANYEKMEKFDFQSNYILKFKCVVHKTETDNPYKNKTQHKAKKQTNQPNKK